LLRRVWPDRAVGENILAVQISVLRKEFGVDRTHRFVTLVGLSAQCEVAQ
jgi:DNA-binding winged helix-turn-helix (wHTH) protein